MTKAFTNSILIPLRLFLRDFAIFSGAKGVKALIFIFFGALVEGVGLVLLIPFFSVIIDSQATSGRIQSATTQLFALFSVESRFAKLSLLVALFAALMVARAVIITVRQVTMAQLGFGFVQHIRSRITRRLAAAQWDTVSRLRHSRVTYLMGADIEQVESAAHSLLRESLAVVMLASQVVLAVLLAPALAALVLGLVLLGAMAMLPMLRRAREVGSFVTSANLSLIDNVTQFLGALKLAISQNLQDSFTREFEATLDAVKAQQVRFIRQQTISQLAITTLCGARWCPCDVFGGYGFRNCAVGVGHFAFHPLADDRTGYGASASDATNCTHFASLRKDSRTRKYSHRLRSGDSL